jgi:hypothetical protein
MSNVAVEHVWEDRFGSVTDHDDGYLEIRWYDATEDMSAKQFQEWLVGFAGEVEKRRRRGVLVDATSFRMDPAKMNEEWRNEHITPRYNAGGLEKWAFHMPEGMPAIGAPPQREGPAKFTTGYFGRRQDALAWLASAG